MTLFLLLAESVMTDSRNGGVAPPHVSSLPGRSPCADYKGRRSGRFWCAGIPKSLFSFSPPLYSRYSRVPLQYSVKGDGTHATVSIFRTHMFTVECVGGNTFSPPPSFFPRSSLSTKCGAERSMSRSSLFSHAGMKGG